MRSRGYAPIDWRKSPSKYNEVNSVNLWIAGKNTPERPSAQRLTKPLGAIGSSIRYSTQYDTTIMCHHQRQQLTLLLRREAKKIKVSGGGGVVAKKKPKVSVGRREEDSLISKVKSDFIYGCPLGFE